MLWTSGTVKTAGDEAKTSLKGVSRSLGFIQDLSPIIRDFCLI